MEFDKLTLDTAAHRAATVTAWVRMGGIGAIVAGALRMVAALIPYDPASIALELLYGAIDVAFLLALLGLTLGFSRQLGRVGTAAAVVAAIAIASIIGPDAQKFGVDFYQIGAAVFAIALAVMGGVLAARRVLVWPALLWTLSIICGMIAMVTNGTIMTMLAGVMLGAGTIGAGLSMVRALRA